MDWFWNWGGECFGYQDGDGLFTYYGREVGRFDGEEIYGSNGRYLGEVMNENRLITSRAKKSWVRGSFGPRTSGSYARYANYAGYAMYAGYEDFSGAGSLSPTRGGGANPLAIPCSIYSIWHRTLC